MLLTYALIVFGGYVASTESGMGCGPEWPLCNGEVIPTLEGATLIEFAHRVIGAILFLFSFLLFIKILRNYSSGTLRAAAHLMFILLLVEVTLGAIVVILDLPPIVVTIHLLIAMFFIATLTWIWRLSDVTRLLTFSDKPQRLNTHVNITLFLVIITIGLGAYIKHSNFGVACGWFACGDSIVPNTFPQIMQSLHRYLAVISGIYILVLTFFAFKKKWGSRLKTRLVLASVIVLAQIGIGVLTILTSVSVLWAVLHLATGMAVAILFFEIRAGLSTPKIPSQNPSIEG